MNLNEEQIGLRSNDMEANIGLVSAHVTGQLSGLVAQIKVRQVYKNWSDSNIECVYTFPMAWQSVLLGMRVELNGKCLTGSVKPKKVAEALYEKAIDSGDLPVMLEKSGKDLYTANIGNIQPGDEVVIELDYAQILKAVDGAIRFSIPTTIAPRYGDAADAGVKPHQQSIADMQAEHRLFLNLTLGESLSAGTVYSPSHEIQTQRQDGKCAIKLEGSAWLDRDFVLVIDRMEDLRFALAAKDPVKPGEATMLTGSVFRPQKTQTARGSTIKVLVDCSGSMQGDSIAQARDCLNWLIGQLGSADKVSFTRFGSTVQHSHPTLHPCTSLYKMALKSAARNLHADLGGTEIDAALKEAIALEGSDRAEPEDAVILLITDGDVWNIEATIATVRASGHRIYAVGVGSAPAESLLREMAEVTGGSCELVTPRESMQNAVERLLIQMKKTQAIEQDITCSPPVLWQSQAARHAVPGDSLTTWTQVQTEEALDVAICNQPGNAPAHCPVVWETEIELSRIAAAHRLNDMAESEEREAIALAYQLVTSETNLILVHERTEAEKAEELPELHQVRPMLAAGWGGNGSVAKAHFSPHLQVMRTGCDNVPFNLDMDSVSMCMSISPSTPAVWRSSRRHAAARVDSMASSGMDDIEIPAFLRKQSDGGGTNRPTATLAVRTESTEKNQVPQPSSFNFVQIYRRASCHENPVVDLVRAFNQAALSHSQFRPALAVSLRTSSTDYLLWLVIKHMKVAGSAAPIWAVFISWAVERFSVTLDRHAERLLRDFLRSINADFQEQVRAELDALTIDPAP